MAFKFVAVLAFVGVACAGVIVPAAPVLKTVAAVAPVAVAQPVLAKAAEEFDPHPQYKYSYDVQDSLSGDSKSQVEERDGDVVHGQYSLIDADGFRRIVHYTADPVNGFNAVVNRVPLEHVKTVVKTAPAVAVAPAVYTAASPVAAVVKTSPVVVKAAAPMAVAAPTVAIAH